MKIEVNINKWHFVIILSSVLVLAGIFITYAYDTNDPRVFGHTVSEVTGAQARITTTECPDGKAIVQIKSDGGVKCEQAYLFKPDIEFYSITGNSGGGSEGESIGQHDFCFLTGFNMTDNGNGKEICKINRVWHPEIQPRADWYLYSRTNDVGANKIQCYAICIN